MSDEKTPDRLLEKMRNAAANGDINEAHVIADEILIDRLRQHGDDELCDLWEKVPKWYA